MYEDYLPIVSVELLANVEIFSSTFLTLDIPRLMTIRITIYTISLIDEHSMPKYETF